MSTMLGRSFLYRSRRHRRSRRSDRSLISYSTCKWFLLGKDGIERHRCMTRFLEDQALSFFFYFSLFTTRFLLFFFAKTKSRKKSSSSQFTSFQYLCFLLIGSAYRTGRLYNLLSFFRNFSDFSVTLSAFSASFSDFSVTLSNNFYHTTKNIRE